MNTPLVSKRKIENLKIRSSAKECFIIWFNMFKFFCNTCPFLIHMNRIKAGKMNYCQVMKWSKKEQLHNKFEYWYSFCYYQVKLKLWSKNISQDLKHIMMMLSLQSSSIHWDWSYSCGEKAFYFCFGNVWLNAAPSNF